MDALIEYVGKILEWLLDLVLWVPRKVFELLTDAVAAAISAIPAPDWLTAHAGNLSGMASGAVWLLDLAAASEGLSMVLSALLLRFGLKAIPTLSF